MWLATWTIVTLQQYLPLNPDGIGNMEPALAFNTISSFTTNTNLQHYSGETGLSYFSQMFVISFLQFVTAATGVAAAVAIIRGLAGNRLTQLGNFYVDLTRATFRLFLPLALFVSVLMIWQGVPMTFEGAATATTVEGAEQKIARGVTAGVVSIKQLGTNGGGYFGPNSTHPFENPTPLSNFIQTWCITIVPMSMVVMLGYMLGRRKLAVVIFATMLAIYLPMVAFGVAQEAGGNPAIAAMGVDQSTGSMEGKEVRFGAGMSALWAVTTTVTSNGSVNAMHDSLTPLGGLMPLIGMWLNNIFGGVGVGFINMLIFVIVAVFVAGMMIGRTPEFLGKKVEAKEMKLASLALLWHPLAILDPNRHRLLRLGDHRGSRRHAGVAEESGVPRLLGDALRVHLGGRQQRLGLRRPRRQHAVLERLDRPGDAVLALHPDHRAAGAGGDARGQAGVARDRGFAARRQRDVRIHAVGGHRRSRPADVHASRGARPDCRASGAQVGS